MLGPKLSIVPIFAKSAVVRKNRELHTDGTKDVSQDSVTVEQKWNVNFSFVPLDQNA